MNVSVYTTNDNGVDFSDATRFLHNGGTINHITSGTQNIFNTDTLIRSIENQVKKMNPQDFLLVTGNSYLAGLVMACVYERFSKLNVLIWDHRYKMYRNAVVEFE